MLNKKDPLPQNSMTNQMAITYGKGRKQQTGKESSEFGHDLGLQGF